jgi:hypothetical protein
MGFAMRLRSGERARPWRWCVAVWLCVAVFSRAAAADSEDALVSETQIKAAFIYNFTKFIEWPEESFPGKGKPIVIGILGETPLTAELGVIVTDRKVNGRPIVVKSVRTAEDLAPLQVLFVSAADDAAFGELAPAIAGNALLTVGESPGFAAANGAIVFVRLDGKLRFEINLPAAEQAGLKISGELQKLAATVKRAPR